MFVPLCSGMAAAVQSAVPAAVPEKPALLVHSTRATPSASEAVPPRVIVGEGETSCRRWSGS